MEAKVDLRDGSTLQVEAHYGCSYMTVELRGGCPHNYYLPVGVVAEIAAVFTAALVTAEGKKGKGKDE